ncbi:MAG: MOSC domain-containing protein [Paracoccaceae bacterium]|jgi:hypothetical protein
MPVLRKTEFVGEIIWLGEVPAGGSLRAQARSALELSFEGVAGERHFGTNQASCMRVKNLHPQGMEIRNVRQLTILSEEELEMIARDMKLDRVNPEWLGATMVVRGIPDFTHIPPSSRLQGPDGWTLVADMENRPCIFPGREIEQDKPGHGPLFKTAATGRRGITAWVQRPGHAQVGQQIAVFVPDQRAWSAES